MASNKPTTRLRELRGSGYEIAKGQPDIRGWDVRDDNGRKFGRVQELIFDIRARKVRYIVVDVLDVRELELEKRTVLVPIGLAELDSSDDDVIFKSVTPFHLRALPRYDKNNLGAKVERDVSTVFGRTGIFNSGADADMDSNFYEHNHFNEDNINRNRRLQSGTSNIEEEQKSHPLLTNEDEATRRLRQEAQSDKQGPSAGTDGVRRTKSLIIKDTRETDEDYFRRTGKHRDSQ